jgi:hypothetical protein
MKKLTLVFVALFAVTMFTTSCRDEADTTEETMEETMEETSDELEDAADDMEDAADDMEDVEVEGTEMGTEEGA